MSHAFGKVGFGKMGIAKKGIYHRCDRNSMPKVRKTVLQEMKEAIVGKVRDLNHPQEREPSPHPRSEGLENEASPRNHRTFNQPAAK